MTQALRQILADQEKLTAAAKAHRSALKQFATVRTCELAKFQKQPNARRLTQLVASFIVIPFRTLSHLQTLTESRSLFTVTSSDAREPVGIAAAALKKARLIHSVILPSREIPT